MQFITVSIEKTLNNPQDDISVLLSKIILSNIANNPGQIAKTEANKPTRAIKGVATAEAREN